MTAVIVKGLEYTNDAQCNYSPPTDRRPVSPRVVISPPIQWDGGENQEKEVKLVG